MKTGFSPVKESNKPNLDNNLLNILELFTSNAIKNSARFVKLCDRNGMTKEDIKYGLIYEVFEFFKRDTNLKDLKEIEELNKTETLDYEEFIIEDDELMSFSKIDIDSISNSDDKEFVTKLYKYYDGWDDWIPTTPLEKIIKKSINKSC